MNSFCPLSIPIAQNLPVAITKTIRKKKNQHILPTYLSPQYVNWNYTISGFHPNFMLSKISLPPLLPLPPLPLSPTIATANLNIM